MYGTTDEMWFENWEKGGAYWDKIMQLHNVHSAKAQVILCRMEHADNDRSGWQRLSRAD